jgi:hypothetical protein
VCGLVVGLALSGVAAAQGKQPRDPLTIENIQIGFATAPVLKQTSVSDALYKHGAWTPVYVAIKCNFEYRGTALLVTEAPDCDDVPVRYAVPIPRIPVGQVDWVIGYARPGGRDPTMAIHILKAREENGLVPSNTPLADSASAPNRGMDPAQFLFLSIGSRLDGNKLPGFPPGLTDENRNQLSISGNTARSLLANITSLQQMPTIWFGYQGVDTVLLTTGDRTFMDALVSERDGRKAALAEWVRRGGRIVVSVGKNGDQLAGAGELSDLLPVLPTGTAEVDVNRATWVDAGSTDDPLGPMTIAKLTPKSNRPLKTLAKGPKLADGSDLPMVLGSAFGFGRVTVVAFDLDDRAVTKWKGRDGFWRELMNRSGQRLGPDTINAAGVQFGGRFQPYGENAEDNELTGLIQAMERFPDVPVISFGWVALFILIYIIIVGPLDYWFLKRVVKRLEFTWITFPTIVLIVSAAAYYAAYALKGSSLRINKHDLVDVDVASQQIMGRSWFTIFSPRIQNYQIGAEPTPPIWSAGAPLDVIVGWAGQSRYNSRQSLFRRSYDVRPKATGLENVPIQVWSTKGFQCQWSASLKPEQPIFSADIKRAPDGKGLIGAITSHLPDALENAVLIERGPTSGPTVRVLGTLLPGAAKTVSAQEARPLSQWVENPYSVAPPANGVYPEWFATKLFFHDLLQGQAGQVGIASLRDLDMSWRLNGTSGDVAIIIGIMPWLDGDGEDIMNKPATATQLWLGAFPGTGVQRPRLDGKLRQETCVRIIVPIQPAVAAQPQP